MQLDEAQAFLCAALTGPKPLAAEDWLPLILGEAWQECAAGAQAADLLREYAGALDAQLAAGEAPDIIVYEEDDADDQESKYVAWCNAYLAGVDASEEDWFEALGDDDEHFDEDNEEAIYVDERLFPIIMITGEAEAAAREHNEEWPQGEELATLRRECEEDLPQAVVELYRFWRAQRGTPTLRRTSPKVGRNDPCPCGSGRKYKACCGLGA